MTRSRGHNRSNRLEFITEFRSDRGEAQRKVPGWVDESAADKRGGPLHKVSRSGPYLRI